jgi:glycosyltransferase involved in cell wall biosynthesis
MIKITYNTNPEKLSKKISVIVTAYNHEKYIAQCLDSIIMQKGYFDLEVILGDDCSKDTTRKIMMEYSEKYPGLFVLLPPQANLGIPHNIKRCLKACSGDYIAFCEGDDYWTDSYKLQKQLDFMESHPAYSLCFNAIVIYREESNRFETHFDQLHMVNDTLTIEDLIEHNAIGNFSCCMYRTIDIQALQNKLFDIPMADWLFNMACGQIGKIGFIRDWMSVYRIHDNGAWSSISRGEQYKQLLSSIENYDQFFDYKYNKQFNQLKESAIKKYSHMTIKKIGGLLIRAIKNPGKAFQMIKTFIQDVA